MPLLAGWQSRRTATRALAALNDRGWDEALHVLNDAPSRLQGGPSYQLALALHEQGKTDDARRALQHALQLDPKRWDALVLLATLEEETGHGEQAIIVYQQMLSSDPRAAKPAQNLGRLLLAQDRCAEAADVLQRFSVHPSQEGRLLLGRALFGARRAPEVIALLEPLIGEMKQELESTFGGTGRLDLVSSYEEARQLYDDAYASLHGRERVIESAIHRGHLDVRAGVNYRLLAEARMAHTPRWAPDPVLRSVPDSIRYGETLIAQRERSRGLSHLGAAALRQLRLDEARRFFEEARTLDDENFAPYLGLGALLDLERADVMARLDALDVDPDAPPRFLSQVVVDWPVLTPDERRAVVAAARPLASLLGPMAAAGAQVRLLPIDARLTDLPAFMSGGDRRFEDERCLRSITGAATAVLCASKIEELLDLTEGAGWVFAHELAHLAHHHAPQVLQEAIVQLYQRATSFEYTLTTYQASNAWEFFAVGYTDYLAHLYGWPLGREFDEEGILQAIFDLVEQLG